MQHCATCDVDLHHYYCSSDAVLFHFCITFACTSGADFSFPSFLWAIAGKPANALAGVAPSRQR